MASVAEALHQNHVIVHDISLRGESDVKHQIDVYVSSNETSEPKRILIECKDYSKEKVGLSIVRDFSAVVDDVKPTHATIVTCVGYTEDAIRFATHKGIRLCTLQIYDKKSDKLESIGIHLTLLWPSVKHAEFLTDTEGQVKIQEALLRAGATDIAEEGVGVRQIPLGDETPVYIRFGEKRLQIMEHMRDLVRGFIAGWGEIGERKFEWKNEAFLEAGDEPPIRMDGIILVVEQEATEDYFTVAGSRIAELVLRYLDESEDRVIYRDELGTPPPAGGGEPKA